MGGRGGNAIAILKYVKPKLIIIPVFNEKTIEILLKKIFKIKISKQIIVVDDCSSDGTRNILKKYQNKIDKIIFHKKSWQRICNKKSQKFIGVIMLLFKMLI